MITLDGKQYQVIRLPLEPLRLGASTGVKAKPKVTTPATKMKSAKKTTTTTTIHDNNDYKPKWIGVLRGEIKKLRERFK